MNILINDTKDFGFLWDEGLKINNWQYGRIQIIIGDNIYPNYCIENAYTLQTVFSSFKNSFIEKYYPGGYTGKDFGEKSFNIDAWNNLEVNDVFVIETTEMGGGCENQLSLCMGYSENTERLFYSFDNEVTFQEIRYPRGTVEGIVNMLPTHIK